MSPASRPRRHPLRKAQRSEIAGDISAHSGEVDAQACRTLGGAPSHRSLREEGGVIGANLRRIINLSVVIVRACGRSSNHGKSDLARLNPPSGVTGCPA
jgi:hypothetical protein